MHNAPTGGSAWFDGLHATAVDRAESDPAVLDEGGWWAVLIGFEGWLRLWRCRDVRAAPLPQPRGDWPGIEAAQWTSSLTREDYLRGVEQIRRRIVAGEVYQVNLCRTLSAPVAAEADPWALAQQLADRNPAPYAGVLDLPAIGELPATRVVCASPELFLARQGRRVRTGPIKGTATTAEGLLTKDRAENVMIVDLMRNDLSRVAEPGTVTVPDLMRLEQHPGLVHLVSDVTAELPAGLGWAPLLQALLPPGSVSGAPKSTALQAIGDLEPVPRGPYCGAVGYVDADRGVARLAVAIRTFWWQDGRLCLGTGAGITIGSDPVGEWDETCLKASRLTAVAERTTRERV